MANPNEESCSREIGIFPSFFVLYHLISGAQNDRTLFWKNQKCKSLGCLPFPQFMIPEPGPHLKVPDDIYPALETCSSSQDGLPKAALHLEGPLEDGIDSKHDSGYT